MLAGLQILAGRLTEKDVSPDEIVHFYREARICGKDREATEWMLDVLPLRSGEDFHSERRLVLAECIASLIGPGEAWDNLARAIGYQGTHEPNQGMIEEARVALELSAILADPRIAAALAAYNPLERAEHELWFEALSRTPDERCAQALLAFLRRGRLFVTEGVAATEAALRNYGPRIDRFTLRQLSEIDGLSVRSLRPDGSYSAPEPIDGSEIRRLATEALARR